MRVYLYIVLSAIWLVFCGLYGIDREMARQDYLDGQWADHCIFQSNCDYYNSLEIKED